MDNQKVVPIEVDICSQRPKTEAELQQDREEAWENRHPYQDIVDLLNRTEAELKRDKDEAIPEIPTQQTLAAWRARQDKKTQEYLARIQQEKDQKEHRERRRQMIAQGIKLP